MHDGMQYDPIQGQCSQHINELTTMRGDIVTSLLANYFGQPLYI